MNKLILTLSLCLPLSGQPCNAAKQNGMEFSINVKKLKSPITLTVKCGLKKGQNQTNSKQLFTKTFSGPKTLWRFTLPLKKIKTMFTFKERFLKNKKAIDHIRCVFESSIKEGNSTVSSQTPFHFPKGAHLVNMSLENVTSDMEKHNFGANWQFFIDKIDDQKIPKGRRHL